MSKQFDIDLFWPSIAVIVLVVMYFNTVRARDNSHLIQTCLQQHKTVNYDIDKDIKGCK
jgi:hypothetical protein